MIESLAELLRAAAGAHVKAMDDETRLQRVPGHADDITGIAAAFKTMQQHNFAHRRAGRLLGKDQNLGIGIRPDETAFRGVSREIELARPEVA